MAQVYPFRAFRYDPKRAPFDRVLTQPYDKISSAMQEKYYTADPHSLIAVEKGRAYPSDAPQNNVYTRAAAAIENWIRDQIVVQDPAPSFYSYTQEYTVPGTEERRTRRGFVGAGKLEEYSAGVVFRHEHTLSGPKADRLELLRHTKTHTGQLFMLYSDAAKRIDAILAEAESATAPATEMRDEYGVLHRLWVIAEPQRVAAIQKAMEDQKLVIADGHHRYETALNYRDECRVRAGKIDPHAPYERVMMTFVNTRSEGLMILPGHRVVAHVHDFSWSGVRRHLEPWFAAEEFPFSGSGERAEAKAHQLAGEAGHRRLSRSRGAQARVLLAHAPRRRQPRATPAQCFAAAARTRRGAAARRNPGTGAGHHAASGDRGSQPDLRTRGQRRARSRGRRARANFVFAQSLRRRASDENRHRRRSHAAKIYRFLSQTNERHHHVSRGRLNSKFFSSDMIA